MAYLQPIQQNERMRSDIDRLDAELEQQKKNSQQLQTELNALRNDPQTVERLAREKLGYARPDETVIRFQTNALTSSKIYRDYVRAFNDMTGLPLALQPVETWQLPHHGHRNENPFCAMISRTSRACAACLQTQERLCARAAREPQAIICPAGLCDTAVPVRMSDRLIGYLQCGHFFRKKPDKKQFERTAGLVAKWGLDVDTEKLKAAYFSTKVINTRQQ